VYVKEQMGHSSILVTVDIYGHLIPSANISFVDRLDETVKQEEKTTLQQNATQAQSAKSRGDAIPPEVADLVGGGGRTRTYDLRIMRPLLWPPELRRHIVNKILILDFHRLFHLLFGRNTPWLGCRPDLPSQWFRSTIRGAAHQHIDDRRGRKPIAPDILLRPHHRLPSCGSIRTTRRTGCVSLSDFEGGGSDRVLTLSARDSCH
jgi:hypothetical protein